MEIEVKELQARIEARRYELRLGLTHEEAGILADMCSRIEGSVELLPNRIATGIQDALRLAGVNFSHGRGQLTGVMTAVEKK